MTGFIQIIYRPFRKPPPEPLLRQERDPKPEKQRRQPKARTASIRQGKGKNGVYYIINRRAGQEGRGPKTGSGSLWDLYTIIYRESQECRPEKIYVQQQNHIERLNSTFWGILTLNKNSKKENFRILNPGKQGGLCDFIKNLYI